MAAASASTTMMMPVGARLLLFPRQLVMGRKTLNVHVMAIRFIAWLQNNKIFGHKIKVFLTVVSGTSSSR